MKLLLVEDNEQLNKALSTVLKRNSYLVDSAFDGQEALLLIKQFEYDAIILDIMLPLVNGLEVLKTARMSGIKTPILLLTAKSTVEDKIAGLDLGADDYLAKPFNVDELLARIRALVRRPANYAEKDELTFADLQLDRAASTLICGEKKTVLMNKESQILSLLMAAGGQIVSLERIANAAWSVDDYSTSENVWVFISYLRKKIQSISSKVRIRSIRYQGYRLEVADD